MDKGKGRDRPTASSRKRKLEELLRKSSKNQSPESSPDNAPVHEESSDQEHPDNTAGAEADSDDEEDKDVGDKQGDDEDKEGNEEKGQEDEEESDIPHPPLLPGFKNHVARYIFEGTERDVLKCHSHVVKLLAWDVDSEKDYRHWKGMFRKSKLLSLRRCSYKNPNKNLITAFVERWHPETNSFHLPFGEMSITLDDVFCITGLRVDGIPVQSKPDEKGQGLNDLIELLGVSPQEAVKALEGVRGSSVKLTWLRETFAPMMGSHDDTEVLYSARAYVLYTFGTTLFADKSGTRVSTSWLQYTRDMSKFGDYAWGTAALAYLYRQLGQASQFKVRQIAGYLTLLEAWIYEHFSALILPPKNVDFEHPEPLSCQYTPDAHTTPSIERVRAFRERLDVFTPTMVTWTPYHPLREFYTFQQVSFFHGCIVSGDVIEPYMPDRVLRQYGYVQTIPEPPLAAKRSGSRKERQVWMVLAGYYATWDTHVLSVDRLGDMCKQPWEASYGYVDWFVDQGHPVVSNPDTTRLNAPVPVRSADPWVRIDAAKFELTNLVDKYESDEPFALEDAVEQVRKAITILTGPEGGSSSSRVGAGRATGSRVRVRGRGARRA